MKYFILLFFVFSAQGAFSSKTPKASDKQQAKEKAQKEQEEKDNLLFSSISEGPLALRQALEAGANPNARDDRGLQPLHYAVSKSIEGVKILLEYGADPNLKENLEKSDVSLTRDSPLHYAVPFAPVVQLLLSAGANPDITSDMRLTPLHIAVDHEDTLEVLLNAGADPEIRDGLNRTVLHYSAQGYNSTALKLLLSKTEVDINAQDFTGETALFQVDFSAKAGLEIFKILLNAGADPKIQSSYGNILHKAIRAGAPVSILQALLDKDKALIQGKNPFNGDSPLFLAVIRGDLQVVQLLLDSEADPNVQNQKGETPLHLAVDKGHHEIVLALLARGANPNLKDSEKRTPLHLASFVPPHRPNKDLAHYTVRVLLEARAFPGFIDAEGETALHRATRSPDQGVISALLNYGLSEIQLNALNHYGETALHIAVSNRLNSNPKVAEILLRVGADPLVEDQQGRTPLQIAVLAEVPNVSLIRILKEYSLVPASCKSTFSR